MQQISIPPVFSSVEEAVNAYGFAGEPCRYVEHPARDMPQHGSVIPTSIELGRVDWHFNGEDEYPVEDWNYARFIFVFIRAQE
jgi:hypothetical protein